MIERSPFIEIETNGQNYQAVFSSTGEYILSRGNREIEVLRVKDGRDVARLETGVSYYCLAVSPDGRLIAAGAEDGGVYVWDANTYEQTFILRNDDAIYSIDFSPDSTRLVAGSNNVVIVWDVATRERVLDPLEHEGYTVYTVRYSPDGHRFAAATDPFLRIYDSHSGRLSTSIPTSYESMFRWSRDHLIIMSPNKIEQVDTSSGTTISEWPVPYYYGRAIAVPHDGEFLAYATDSTLTFWDTSIRHHIDLIRHTSMINSISLSCDGHFIAIGDNSRKIVIHELFRATAPLIDLPETILRPWLRDQFAEVEGFLTKKMLSSINKPSYDAYAKRALIRARSGCWNTAIEDAEKSIEAYPSIIGYIAKSVALIGVENKEKIGRVFDLAFRHIPLYDSADPLLLIKAIVLFMAGDRDEAISRVHDLITTLYPSSICYVVLAHMHLLLGDLHMKNNDYESAIQSYERAQSHTRFYAGPFLRTITLISGWKFDGLGITIRQHLCNALYAAGRIKEATKYLFEIVNLFDTEAYVRGSVSKWISDFVHQYNSVHEVNWIPDFKLQCTQKVVHFGDVASDTLFHEDAVIHYSAALLLDNSSPYDILVKRSKSKAAMGLWQEALNDANEATNLDPSLPWGYERKYVALGVAGHHEEKLDAFETMLSKMAQSSDPVTRECGRQYPKTQETIRGVIQDTTYSLPPVLISITSGRLCDRSGQALAFELSPSYAEFVSTMTTQMSIPRIEQEITEYYRYAMFSHKNEASEPLFDEVVNTSIYKLEDSPTHEKLRKFCNIVQDAGFNWAWSNTCCVDSSNHLVVQEALTSMFKWYQESALTVIYLLDIDSPSQQGDLARSIWNSRAWIFQEYHASKVVRFYNNDWTLYRNLGISNHKELPEIISEIVEAIGTSKFSLKDLSPGLGDIRPKLYLASSRETTLVEDAAYSLFGIFSLSLPVVYGEGDKALGHLLSQLVTKSGDTNIIAWTGTAGTFNSCLPSNITVFSDLLPLHVQPIVEESMVDEVAADLRASSLNIALLAKLIDLLKKLPLPLFVGQELKLPCLTFKIGPVSASDTDSDRIFNVQTPVLGNVEIRTQEDLSIFESLYLVHPWIDYLLDSSPGRGLRIHGEESEYERSVEEVLAFPTRSNNPLGALVQERASRLVARLKQFRRPRPRSRSESPPVPLAPAVQVVPSQGNRQMKVVQLAARLQQPFDALLMAPNDHEKGKYRRVAADCRITVQVGEITAPVLKQLAEGVQVLDVL